MGLGERVAELNHRGVKIAREAREAAKHEVLIAGSIGPAGLLRHVRDLPDEEILDIFREQAGALEERGVDLFILETFSDVEELILAIDAIRSFSRLPIIAQVTYSAEGTTFSGKRPHEACEQLKEKDIQAVGTNCTVGPQLLLPILRELAGCTPRALSAMPNAGFPQRVGRPDGVSASRRPNTSLFLPRGRRTGCADSGGVLRNDLNIYRPLPRR